MVFPFGTSISEVLRRPVESALTPLIRVVNDAPGATLYECHVERTQHQLRVQMIGHRPPTMRRLKTSSTTAK